MLCHLLLYSIFSVFIKLDIFRNIKDERYRQKYSRNRHQEHDEFRWQIWKSDQNPHCDVEHSRGQFAEPFGTVQFFSSFQQHQSNDSHKQFLHHEEDEKNPHIGVTEQKANDDRRLCQFIGNRVDDFPQFGDLIELPGEPAVQ